MDKYIDTTYKPNEPIGPSGFSGWLIIPLLVMIFSPILNIADLSGLFDFMYGMNGMNQILPQSFIESLETSLTLSKMMLFPYTIFTLFVAKLFFTKDYRLPRMYQYLIIANVCIVIVETVSYFIYFRPEWEQLLTDINFSTDYFFKTIDSQVFKNLLQVLISGIIWYAYFNKSIRVKNTFVRNQELGIDL